MSQDSNELHRQVTNYSTGSGSQISVAISRNSNQLLTAQSSSFPITQQQSTTAINVIERSSTLGTANNSAGRRLQIVLVLDKKVQKCLRVREMACADIEAVTNSLNVNLQVIFFFV